MIHINQKIKRWLFISGSILIAGLIICGFYMFLVYLEFLSNREAIFSKIESFSRALNENNETDITLGLEETKNAATTLFFDRNNKIIAQYSQSKHKLVKLEQIPFYLSKGFVIIEDSYFFSHNGINLGRLTLGIIKNIFTLGHSPGGSTISQQLAKILYTNQKKEIKRKIYEIYCTFEMEKRFNKNQILQIYLNSIYLGHGIYGVENAAEFYFGKEVSDLTIAEAALFIGMNRSPENYSPIKYRENAKRIQKVVLNQLVKIKFLTKEDSELEYERFWKRYDQVGVRGNQSFWRTDINRSGYITEYIRQILEKEFSYEKIMGSSLIVRTTIDLDRQLLAEEVIKDQLKYIKGKVTKYVEESKKKELTNKDIDNIETSFASIDYKTGEILALVGGSRYSFANQFNRAINAFRPIGSTVKPFIYSMALMNKQLGDKDIHPFSKFKDEIKTYIINGKKYRPQNFDLNHKYGDLVTLYDAIKRSLNTVSVQVLDQMDIPATADLIRKAAGLYTNEDKKRVPEVLSLALGTCELSTLELATAYSVIARSGKTVHPMIIKSISDAKGNMYYDYTRENNPNFNFLNPPEGWESTEIIKPEVAYEILQMMRSVFEKDGTAYWAAYITNFKIPASGKSGTSQDFKDDWFAGITDREASVSWIGLDNNKSIYIPGSISAAIVWCDYNARISSGKAEAIPRPNNMKLVPICMDTGLQAGNKCPNIKEFYFWIDGPIPEKCYIHEDNNPFGL